jgi:cation-transporting ATPase 13A3/4/5
MTVGTGFSMMRLKRLKIYCISPPRVNVSGRVSIMVLDKTGTLTEDGLQVLGFRSCHISTEN